MKAEPKIMLSRRVNNFIRLNLLIKISVQLNLHLLVTKTIPEVYGLSRKTILMIC